MTFFLMLACIFSANAQISDLEKNIALELATKSSSVTGLSQSDLDNSIVANTYIIPATNIRMLYLQQSYKDIPVYNRLNVLAFKNEQMVSNAGSRIANLEQKLANSVLSPAITSVMAVKAALVESKVNTERLIIPVKFSANGQKLEFGNLNASTENITAELIWFPFLLLLHKLMMLKRKWLWIFSKKTKQVWRFHKVTWTIQSLPIHI